MELQSAIEIALAKFNVIDREREDQIKAEEATTYGELKDSIDALGYQPERHHAFTRGLLAEAEDEILQSIVQEASIISGRPS